MFKSMFAMVVAVCAMSAAATASAVAALPEFGNPIAQLQLKGGEVALEITGTSSTVKCKTMTSTKIELLTSKKGVADIVFKECKFSPVEKTCTTTGAAAGEIVATKNMPWQLFYTVKASKEVAMVFNYESPSTTFAAFACGLGVTSDTVRGAVIAKITPINTKTTKFTLSLKGSKGAQELTKYENASGEMVTATLENSLNGGAFANADLNATSLELIAAKENSILG